MNPEESSVNFSVFALHKPSYKVIEKIKADGFKSTLPLALGALGLSLLIVSHIAKAEEPLNLGQAPLEIRARNLSLSDHSSAHVWENPLSLESHLPGHIENARWKVGFESLSLAPWGWRIEGSQAHILVDRWKFESKLWEHGFGLNLECSQADLSFLPPYVDLPWPQDLKIQVGVSESKLLLKPSWNVEAWVEQILRPYFAPQAIDQNVHMDASCSGGTESLFDRLLRARLKDFPNKDPDVFENSVQRIATAVRSGIDQQLKALLPNAPAGVQFQTILAMTREADGSLVLRPDGTRDFLTPQARALLKPLPDNAQSIEVILSPSALNRLMVLGMSGLASKNGGIFKDGNIYYRVGKDFPAEKYSAYISELAQLKADTVISAQIVLPISSDNPSVKPWISSGGLSGGLDLSSNARLELLNVTTSEVVATRSFGLDLSFNDNRGVWKYVGGHCAANEKSGTPASHELSLTLDWMLNSESFHEFMEKQMNGAWGLAGSSPQFRRVGQALAANRRTAGGYYAEALVVNFRPSF